MVCWLWVIWYHQSTASVRTCKHCLSVAVQHEICTETWKDCDEYFASCALWNGQLMLCSCTDMYMYQTSKLKVFFLTNVAAYLPGSATFSIISWCSKFWTHLRRALVHMEFMHTQSCSYTVYVRSKEYDRTRWCIELFVEYKRTAKYPLR